MMCFFFKIEYINKRRIKRIKIKFGTGSEKEQCVLFFPQLQLASFGFLINNLINNSLKAHIDSKSEFWLTHL